MFYNKIKYISRLGVVYFKSTFVRVLQEGYAKNSKQGLLKRLEPRWALLVNCVYRQLQKATCHNGQGLLHANTENTLETL